MELTNSLFREDAGTWGTSTGEMDMGLMAAEDAFHEQMYQGSSQGPPSVHSVGSRHNPYQGYDPQGLDPLGPHYGHVDAPMDMDPNDMGFDGLDNNLPPPPPPHPQQQQQQQPNNPQQQGGNQMAAWYDTDL